MKTALVSFKESRLVVRLHWSLCYLIKVNTKITYLVQRLYDWWLGRRGLFGLQFDALASNGCWYMSNDVEEQVAFEEHTCFESLHRRLNIWHISW